MRVPDTDISRDKLGFLILETHISDRQMATSIGQILLRKKGQITCSNHRERRLELYCDKCETLVCLKCILSAHKGHSVCEISDITPKIKQEIQEFIDRAEQNDLLQLSKCMAYTNKLLKDNTNSFENLDISLKQSIQEDKIKLLKYKHDLEVCDRKLKQQIQECKAALQQGSHIDIYDARCDINSQVSLPVKPILCTANLNPNANPADSPDQDGSVRTSGGREPSSQKTELKGKKTMTMYKLLPETKVLGEWESSPGVGSICPTTDGQVWTRCYGNTLTLLDRKGKILEEVNHKTNVNDMNLSPTSYTLWVCDTENDIMELVSGRLISRFSTKEEPRCICVTVSNHVIVGMTNNISKFSTKGDIVLTTTSGRTEKPLVCSPYRISECPLTHYLAVIDWNNKEDGGDMIPHVIGMDTDFKELFVYRGDIACKKTQNRDRPFNPWAVVYDSVGNIIIGDCNNNRVLLINGRGEFLKIIHTDAYRTLAVGIDMENILWAVFLGRKVKLLQYSSM